MTSFDLSLIGLGNVDIPSILVDPVLWITFGLIIFAGLFFLRRWRQSQDPDGRFIGEMSFSTRDESFKARVFEATDIDKQENLDLIKGTPQGRIVADILTQNKGRMFFYWLQMQPSEDGTLNDGTAFLLTHSRLDDAKFCTPGGNHWDLWRGRIYVRKANPASADAVVWRDHEGVGGGTRHLIYYPMIDYDSLTSIQIENPKATIAIAAEMAVYVKATLVHKTLEYEAKAASEHAENMTSLAIGLRGENNELTALLAQKRFDSLAEWLKGAGLDAIIGLFIGIASAAIGLMLLRPYFPQSDPAMVAFLGGMFGFIPVLILRSRRKPTAIQQVS